MGHPRPCVFLRLQCGEPTSARTIRERPHHDCREQDRLRHMHVPYEVLLQLLAHDESIPSAQLDCDKQ